MTNRSTSLLRTRSLPTSFLTVVTVAALFLVLFGVRSAHAQSLQVTYGSKGVQTISYGGVVLEDVGANGNDAFHIWHMKSSDLQGNTMNSGQYGWGESNNGESWDPDTKTETYTFSWGKIATQFIQRGNNLDMVVTETNYPNSGIVFDGAEIYPFSLHFPQDPAGFYGYTQYAITTIQPGVSVADFGVGRVTSVIPDESAPLYGGWKVQGWNTYSPLMSATYPDGIATFLPHNDAPVRPGATFSYTVSLRFTPPGTDADAKDAYASFAKTYPSQMTWTDKRLIGTAYVASSPSGNDITRPGGFPTNPRRYFNDSSVNITTTSGLQDFQSRMLTQAANSARNAQTMNAQAVITWDIEGEEYPHSTTYVCSPEQIATVAPEMESMILDQRSPYYGQRLDDAYFKIMSDAGLKIGLCIRPQVFTKKADGSASQAYLTTNASIIANLENKARFANARWGATVFYVDSTVDPNGGTLDPAIFQQLITDLPSFLFIPEESTPRYYAYTAPFYTFLFHTDLGTPASTYNMYPKAFGANLVNDVSADTLAKYTPQLTSAVARGDILMGHAGYWQDNDPKLVSIYTAAGVTTAPALLTPHITWNSPAAISYGMALSGNQLNAIADVAGTFIYAPVAGTVLGAGNATLLTTFTPVDSSRYTSATASTTLQIARATPTLQWPSPSAITYGSALSALQLNATASVPGTFVYSPAVGAVLVAGTGTLRVVFTPSDTSNYAPVSASVNLTVTQQSVTDPILVWATPRSITYGTRLSSTQLNATSNVAGVFRYLPAAGSLVNAGSNTLTVTFTPSDTTRYRVVTTVVQLTVAQVTPSIAWYTPAAISAGTALSATQLNARASVSGSFAYTPAAGTVLNVGKNYLSAVFTPTDTRNYAVRSASVGITVNAAAPVAFTGPLAILSPTVSQVVSGKILVQGRCNLFLDAAGTFLMVDGQEVGTGRVGSAPFIYELDTKTLSNGPHILQLWGHDIGNNTNLSNTVLVTVAN